MCVIILQSAVMNIDVDVDFCRSFVIHDCDEIGSWNPAEAIFSYTHYLISRSLFLFLFHLCISRTFGF